MTRKKVKLAWIVSDSARKASLKKRRAGLLKKVTELSILCGIEAAVIIFSPDDHKMVSWPAHRTDVLGVLDRFFGMPEMERCKKMMTQETLFSEKIAKMKDQLEKQQKVNKEMDMNQIMHQVSHGRSLSELHLRELQGLSWLMDEIGNGIKKRIQYLNQIPSLPPPPPPPPQIVAVDEIGLARGGCGTGWRRGSMDDSLQWDEWFMEMMSNPSENIGSSSGGNGMGLPQGNYTGGSSSNVGNEMGLPQGNYMGAGSSSNVRNGMGLPQGNYMSGSSSNVGNEMGLPNESYKSWPYNFPP